MGINFVLRAIFYLEAKAGPLSDKKCEPERMTVKLKPGKRDEYLELI